jgi:hypothetical protein
MNLFVAFVLILGIGFYLRFVVAMLRELRQYRPRGINRNQRPPRLVDSSGEEVQSWEMRAASKNLQLSRSKKNT